MQKNVNISLFSSIFWFALHAVRCNAMHRIAGIVPIGSTYFPALKCNGSKLQFVQFKIVLGTQFSFPFSLPLSLTHTHIHTTPLSIWNTNITDSWVLRHEYVVIHKWRHAKMKPLSIQSVTSFMKYLQEQYIGRNLVLKH